MLFKLHLHKFNIFYILTRQNIRKLYIFDNITYKKLPNYINVISNLHSKIVTTVLYIIKFTNLNFKQAL